MILVGCLAAAGLSQVTYASVIVGDSSAYQSDSLSTLFEARARLDAGNSQTWKTAFWRSGESVPVATGGNFTSPWISGQAQNFELSYDVNSGMAVWMVDLPSPVGMNTTMSAFQLSPGNLLAGFQLFARSEGDGSSTLLDGIEISVNGNGYESIAGLSSLESGGSQVFAESDAVYFTDLVDSFSIRGSITFDWLDGTNLQGDRFRGSIKLIEGELIPAPGALALFGSALLCGARRRRA
ncbi:MAG: hypothetical protein EA377_07425 [Phycisphaerales bacterium]|nr:MAG: hypothetical protein EA377_07425 [Phycisphaerales bacterium]